MFVVKQGHVLLCYGESLNEVHISLLEGPVAVELVTLFASTGDFIEFDIRKRNFSEEKLVDLCMSA